MRTRCVNRSAPRRCGGRTAVILPLLFQESRPKRMRSHGRCLMTRVPPEVFASAQVGQPRARCWLAFASLVPFTDRVAETRNATVAAVALARPVAVTDVLTPA